MPEEVQQAVRTLLQGKKLVPLGGWEAQEALDYGGLAVLKQAWQRFGLDAVLTGVGSERKQRLLKAMIFGRILLPSSKLALRDAVSPPWLPPPEQLSSSVGSDCFCSIEPIPPF